MKRTIHALLAALLVTAPALAATPDALIKARQGNFKQIGKAFKAVSDELKNTAPDLGVIRANAPVLDTLSGKLPTWFPRGTGKQPGVKTEASPAIWQKPADFRAAAARFRNASRAFRGAATSGDIATIKPAFATLGASCKGCHESFRLKD